MEINISSLSNPKIKEIVKLLTKSSFRKESGCFVVDGSREILAALEAGYVPVDLFVSTNAPLSLLSYSQMKLATFVSPEIFSKIAYKENPDGYLAIFKVKSVNINNVKLSDNPLVIILEGVEKPGNLGAVLRTAYAVGADAVICNNPALDIYNPNVVRASEGMIFWTQLVVDSVNNTKKWLKKFNIKPLITSTAASQPYYEVDMSCPTAIVFGSEADGLTNKWLECEVNSIKIPMQMGIDSLNLSVSVGVVAFEAVRQRRMAI